MRPQAPQGVRSHWLGAHWIEDGTGSIQQACTAFASCRQNTDESRHQRGAAARRISVEITTREIESRLAATGKTLTLHWGVLLEKYALTVRPSHQGAAPIQVPWSGQG